LSVDNKFHAGTASPIAPVSALPGNLAPDINDILHTSEVKVKEDTSTKIMENSAEQGCVSSTQKSSDGGDVTESEILSADPSDKEDMEIVKQSSSSESVTSKQMSLQESVALRNADKGADAASEKNVGGSSVAETINPDSAKGVAVAETMEPGISGGAPVPDTGECGAVAKAGIAEVTATRMELEGPAVAEATQDAIATDATPLKVVESTTLDKADVDAVGNGAKTSESHADGAVSSTAVEPTVSGSSDESIPAASFLLAGDDEQCPVSPSSEKEIDLNSDGDLHIDESEASQSENAAGISHTSSGAEEGTLNNDEESSVLCDKTGEILKESGYKKDIISKEGGAVEKSTTATKATCSIEESIERCIANNMVESSEGDAPDASPPKKRTASVAAKPPESQKFPRNYGFKIITNKIDLCSSKPVISTMPKLEASGIPMKKIKIKAKPIVESLVITQEQNAGAEPLCPNELAKGITISVRKSMDESDGSPPKERPTPGLKVRNVESINAAIRTVRAPVCPVYTEEVYKTMDSASSVNEKLPEEEVTDHPTEITEPEKESLLAASRTGRPIAPKCQPIASNDQQTVKLIRDLIQLPSMPVYVPGVSESKHFSGRLHLCHGCGDR